MSFFSVFLLPVLLSLFAVTIGVHGLFAWGPLSWADFSELICVLEGFDESEGLINVSSNWEITD
jgi:hypothetical protein